MSYAQDTHESLYNELKELEGKIEAAGQNCHFSGQTAAAKAAVYEELIFHHHRFLFSDSERCCCSLGSVRGGG